jgi:hypothetical protein
MRIHWNGLSLILLAGILSFGLYINDQKEKRINLKRVSATPQAPCLYVSKTMLVAVEDPSSPESSTVISIIVVKNETYRNSSFEIEAGKSYRMEFGTISGLREVLTAYPCDLKSPSDSSNDPGWRLRKIPDHQRVVPFAPPFLAELFI